MNLFEIYLKSSLGLDAVAQKISEAANLRMSKRYGLNRGGEYFEGSSDGVTVELLGNKGEVLVPERLDWEYYLLVYGDDLSTADLESRVRTISELINRCGIVSEIDELT